MYRILFFACCFILSRPASSQNIPEGYLLQYQQNFSKPESLNDFRFTYPDRWSIVSENKNRFLRVNPDIKDSLTREEAIALIENFIFGDFIFEADVMLSGDQNKTGNVFFNVGIKDSVHFYSIMLNAPVNQNRPDIVITDQLQGNSVAEGEITQKELKKNTWHKVRIERDIVDRTFSFYLDDMKNPVIRTRDRNFVMGYLAFGSTNNTFSIDNIKIWSQTAITKPAGFYLKKE